MSTPAVTATTRAYGGYGQYLDATAAIFRKTKPAPQSCTCGWKSKRRRAWRAFVDALGLTNTRAPA